MGVYIRVLYYRKPLGYFAIFSARKVTVETRVISPSTDADAGVTNVLQVNRAGVSRHAQADGMTSW